MKQFYKQFHSWKVQSHLAVVKVYYKPRMCALSKKNKQFCCGLQFQLAAGRGLDETMTSHGGAAENVAKIYKVHIGRGLWRHD